MEWWAMFVWGFIGAIIPEVVRAHKIQIETKDFYYPKKLFLISVILAISGGVIAVAFEAPNPHNAILIGFATPTIVSTYAGTSPQTTIG